MIQKATTINKLIPKKVAKKTDRKDKETDLIKCLNIDSLIRDKSTSLEIFEFYHKTCLATKQKTSSSKTECTAQIEIIQHYLLTDVATNCANLQCPTALHMTRDYLGVTRGQTT